LLAHLLAGSSCDGPAELLQQVAATQSLRSNAAAAAGPVMPDPRRKARGFSPFTQSNATRMVRAALRFDTGHPL
jgi:hypothetical protein